MAEKKVIDLQINTNIEKTTNDLNKLEASLSKVSKEGDKTKKSVDEVASNGGAIAILDSLTGGLATRFKDAYEATKLFNFSLKGMKSALIATGIGALVVALGTIVAYWDEIVAFISQANEKLQKQIDLNKENVNQLSFELKLLEAKEKILVAEGKSTVEVNRQKEKVLKLLLLENDQLINNLKTQLKRETSQAKELSFFQKLIQLRSQYKLVGEIDTEEKTRLEEINKSIQDATINAETLKLSLIEINKPKEKDKQEKKKELVKQDTSAEDAEFARLEKINAIREKYRLQNEDAEDVTEFEKLERRYQRDLLELERLGASEQQKIDLELYYNSLRTQQQVESIDYLEQLEIEAEDRRLLRLQEDANKQIEIDKIVATSREQIRAAELNNIAQGFNLLGQMAGKSKGLQAAAIIGENAVGIAKQIISTRAANAAVTAKYALIPGGIALAQAEKAINNVSLGLGIGSSIAATSKALSALKTGGSVTGGTAGGDTGGAQAPSFNIVGQGGANQLAQSIGGQNQQPIRTYVVASDVSTSQALDRSIVRSASLG